MLGRRDWLKCMLCGLISTCLPKYKPQLFVNCETTGLVLNENMAVSYIMHRDFEIKTKSTIKYSDPLTNENIMDMMKKIANSILV